MERIDKILAFLQAFKHVISSGARYIQSEIEVLFVTRYTSQPRRRLGLLSD